MMMTMRPTSVMTSSLDRTASDHVTAVVDPFDMRRLAAELQQQTRVDVIGSVVVDSAGGSNRKRLKSAGDAWSVKSSCGSPRETKKPSFLSMFHGRGHKSKSNKLSSLERDADTTTVAAAETELTSCDKVQNDIGQLSLPRRTTRTPDASPKAAASAAAAAINSSSSFSQRKGFNRSISIPTSAAALSLFEPKREPVSSATTFHAGDGYEDFPCKFDCPQTPSSRGVTLKNQSSVESSGTSSLSEIVQALSGPPLNNTPEVLVPISGIDDRSPLLDREISVGTRLAAIAATSFDNIAVIENDATARAGNQTMTSSTTTGADCKTETSSPTLTTAGSLASTAVATSVQSTSGSNSTPWWKPGGQTSKPTGGTSNVTTTASGSAAVGKKRKPRLSISLTSSKDSGGMRQLSASEERKIDEAIQLASQLASMSSFALPSPRSISGSSKESLESPALTSSSGSAFFFSGFRRRHPSEKKTFVDGLQATLSVDVAQQIFTADAQAAYNQLVASSPPPGTEGDSVQSKAPSGRRQELRLHRLHSRDAPIPRNPQQIEARRHHQRSSLSESDQGLVNGVAVLPLAFQNVDGSGSKPRAGSKRSISLSDDTTPTTPFRMEMTSSTATSESTLSPHASVSGSRTEADSSTALDRPPSPPPRLPPRVPMRQSTVNNRPRQRRYQLASSSSTASKTSATDSPVLQHSNSATSVVNSKQRSVSEALPTTAIDRSSRRAAPTPPTLALELPRRAVRSTAAVVDHRAVGTALDINQRGGAYQQRHTSSVGSEPSDASSSLLRSSSSSDDSSVFATDDDHADQPPSTPAPLPPQFLVGGNPSRGSQLPAASHHQQQRGRVSWSLSASGSSRADGGTKLRMNAYQLGFHDARDEFWRNPVDFRLISGAGRSAAASRGADDEPEAEDLETTLSLAEHDLLDEMYSPGPVALRYDTSDAVSYEDLMEFALDGPSRLARTPSVSDGECDEVRLMKKLLSTDVTSSECMAALTETQWDIYSAIKLVKLNRLLNIGLADEQKCKLALMTCRWNVEQAASYLLTSSGNE